MVASMSQPSLIAIIPAAGLSRRMGQPKLLLPWRGTTVIANLVGELRAAGLSQILVVVRSSDDALASAVSSTGATLIQPPNDPPDMRTSVEIGLKVAFGTGDAGDLPSAIELGATGSASAEFGTTPTLSPGRASGTHADSIGNTAAADAWLLIPADHPLVSRSTVDALRAAWQPGQRQILIPTHLGQRGHPTLFSTEFAADVSRIPPDCGLNWLVKQHAYLVREVPVTDPGVTVDLDTPEDYQALLNCPDNFP